MKDNIEKSLKRFLKRKAKITMGFITAFLITGSVGYALTITEDQIKDNTWTNESKIEEQVEVSESLLNKGINISNNGTINSKGNATNNKYSFLGNGIFISDNANIEIISNKGLITGYSSGEQSGNGIYGKLCNIKNIINYGTIIGTTTKCDYYGGNEEDGIGIFIDGYKLDIEKIENNGIIFGKNTDNSGYSYYGQSGIMISGIPNIKQIKNNALIFGKNTDKMGAGSGNGFCIVSDYNDWVNIANIENNGKISGNSSSSLDTFGNSGNGILINTSSSIIIDNMINNGLISGDCNAIQSGNGIGINSRGGIDINSFLNTGIILGTSNYEKVNSGNGIGINSSANVNITNIGVIFGAKGINISKNNKLGELTNYSNAGIVAGRTPVYAQGFTDDLAKSADKGVAIKLDDKGNIESITNGTGGEVNGKKVINADITDKDSSISVDNDTNYANNIINGAGINSGTLNINAKTDVKDSIINAFTTAVNVNDGKEFSASNTIFNGKNDIITDEGNSTISLDKSTINGNIALGSGDSKLTVTNSQINGDIAGGEGNDNLTIGGSNLFYKIDGFEDITFKGDTTLYETAKVNGANRIEIDGGTEVNLRVDSTKKDRDGVYKNHALYNSNYKLLTLAGNTNAIPEDEIDDDRRFDVEENEGRINYDKVSILNLVTSGLGLKSKIDLGNTKVDDTLWVKTDSILTQATKQENEKGTIITIEAEKDLFSINKKFTEIIPGMEIIKPGEPGGPTTTIPGMEIIKPGEPGGPTTTIPGMEIIKPGEPGGPTTTIPGMEIIKPGEPGGPTTTIPGMEIIKPGEPGGPTTKPTDPDKPIDPKPEPDKPQHSIKYYTKLNDIYKGIYSSNDKNFNALNDIVVNYTFSDKDKGNYPIIGNDKAQMETLLGYLNSVYTQNPYAFSNQATRKAMNLFHDSVRDNNFKANNDEWLIYGGLLHQSGDQEQTYYGRNYHGFDTGTADVDADIKLTGAYGQFEYGLSDSLATGIMVGGSKSEVEVGPSKVKGTGAYVGAYAKKDINNFRFTTGLGYQYSEYDGNRRTINETYSSDYQDQAINLYVDGKYSHNLGNNLFLEPKAGLSYTHIDQDSIKENDKALALDIEAKDFDVLEGTVGVDIKKVIPTEKGTHTLTAGVSYNHILDGDNADSLRANYGGSKFDVLVPHKNKGQVSLGAKYEVELENGMFYDVKGNYYVPTDSKDNSNKNTDKGEWRVGIGFGYKF